MTRSPRGFALRFDRCAPILCAALLVPSGTALATDCPSTYSSEDCTVALGSGGTGPVCFVHSTEMICTIDSGGTSSGTIYAVSDGTLCSTYGTCAWGADSNGSPFCCQLDLSSLDGLTINGSPQADYIYLSGTVSGTTYDLLPPSSSDFYGHVNGNTGADTIRGSRTTLSQYQDELYGDGDNDDIMGNQGDDIISGGSGDDTLSGGAGEDMMAGYSGTDIMHGDDDDDVLCGDDGTEGISPSQFTGGLGRRRPVGRRRSRRPQRRHPRNDVTGRPVHL